MRTLRLSAALLLALAAPAGAETPDAGTIVEKMKGGPSAAGDERPPAHHHVAVGESRTGRGGPLGSGAGSEDGGRPRANPDRHAGAARASRHRLLIEEAPDAEGVDIQWFYAPSVRRVRKIVPASKYQGFLHTDFTYADFGFVGHDASFKLVGTAEENGVHTYELEETPRARWYYARVLTWVAADTFLPVKREFYDPANVLWKVERLDAVKIDGIPTPIHIRMDDVQSHGSSEIDAREVHYHADVPDALLDPSALSKAADSPLWR